VPKTEFLATRWVVSQKMVPWAVIGFILSVMYFGWFLVTLFAEQQGWTDNPGALGGLPTEVWGMLGIGLFGLMGLFYTALVIRREIPAQTYWVDDDGQVHAEAPEPKPAPKNPQW
jgi:hypothetical protein